MSGVRALLADLGVTFEEARGFIYDNIANPQLIYNTASYYGVSYEMLAELYGQNVVVSQVKEFFYTQGFDAYGNVPYGAIGGVVSQAVAAQTFKQPALASDVSASPQLVNALLSDSDYWPSSYTITYNTPDTIPTDHFSVVNSSRDWRTLTTLERNAVATLIEHQNSLIDLDVEPLMAGSMLEADIRVAAVLQDNNTEAFAYYPGDGIGGDIFLNASVLSDSSYYASGGYGAHTFIHELGHAMGLDHPFEGDVVLPEYYDNSYYTVMTYSSKGTLEVELENTADGYRAYTEDAYRSDFGILDVAALQQVYGADVDFNADDTVYVYNESERKFESSDDHYLTIWDAGGVDTLDLSDARYESSINLQDFSLSSVSQRTALEEAIEIADGSGANSQSIEFLEDFIDSLGDEAFLNENNLGIAQGVVIENVITGMADDSVRDNHVDNLIYTGGGNDTIYLGAGGYDIVDGGQGVDRVVFSDRSDDVVLARDGNDFQVFGDDYSAQLIGVEWLQFTDTSVSLA